MEVLELLLNAFNVVTGDFNDLNKFNFKGVYILCENNKVVYIGSAYAQTIQKRLKQYISSSDTGNTLGKTIAKERSSSETFDDRAKSQLENAIERIRKFSIYAIEHYDLEYKLIECAQPQYNNYGTKED